MIKLEEAIKGPNSKYIQFNKRWVATTNRIVEERAAHQLPRNMERTTAWETLGLPSSLMDLNSQRRNFTKCHVRSVMYGRLGLSPPFGKSDSGCFRQGCAQTLTMRIHIHTPGDRLRHSPTDQRIFFLHNGSVSFAPSKWNLEMKGSLPSPAQEATDTNSNMTGL